MFTGPALLISIIQAALLLGSVEARIWLLERDGRAIFARRFGQVQPAVLREIASACGGGLCDALADEAVTPLLAGQPECSQQDMADKIIDASRQFDAATQVRMIAAAVRYREAEKNTPPDFSTKPPTLRNSVFCQKAPRNSVLRGLVQAQDPANDSNLFFDPATGTTVTRGSQSNTFPFRANVPVPGDQSRLFARGMMDGTNNASQDNSGGNMDGNNKDNGNKMKHGDHKNNGTSSDNDKGGNMKHGNNMMNGDNKNGTEHKDHHKHCHKNNGGNKMDGNSKNNGTKSDNASNDCKNDNSGNHNGMKGNNGTNVDGAIHKNNGTNLNNGKNGNNGTNLDNGKNNNGTNVTDANNTNNGTVNAGNIGNFGSCSVPEIQFGAGFDGRRETSFEPVDKVSYNHGSAQNIDIITQFMCDQLVNTCKADDTAKSTCAKAKVAADGAPPKTGKQADAFNAIFGKTTNFANVTALDDQGNPIAARSLRRRLSNVLRVRSYVKDA